MRLARVRTTAALAVLVAIFFPATARAFSPAPAPEQAPAPEEADAPPPDDAPPEVRAEYWFGRGERLGESGDFVGAAKSFERSVEIMRTGAGLFNRAVAYEYASMFLEAYAAYEDYRDFVDPRSTEAEMADEAMRKLRGKVGTIELGFARDHVPKQIFVDGDERRPDEFPLLVMPGEHEVVVVERNGERRSRMNRLEPGRLWTVDFAKPTEAVETGPGPGPAFQPPPAFDEIERERRRRIVRSLFYTSLGLTGASGVTLGVFGGLTLREARAFQAAQCGEKSDCIDAGSPDYPADHERNFENFKLTTNVMVGVTAGLAATSVVLGIVGLSGSGRGDDQAEGARVSFGPGAVRMRF